MTMLTLNDLKNYDLKNIDVAKLLGSLQQRKDILVSLAVIIATLFIINGIYTTQKGKVTTFVSRLAGSQEKQNAIQDYKQALEELNRFTRTLPEGPSDAEGILNTINELDGTRNIQISSLLPTQQENTELFKKMGMRLNCSTSSYTDLTQFISDIERSAYNLRIDQWSAVMSTQTQPPLITIDMEIVAIKFKK